MSAIEWDEVETAIQRWLADASGIAPSLVRFEYQGPGEGAYIAVTIDDEHKHGHDWKVNENAPTIAFTADHTNSTFHAVAHGMRTGVGPLALANTGGALPAGLADGSQTFTADATTNECTSAGHGYRTGDGPLRLTNVGGGLPGALAAGVNYWAIRTGVNTFKLATTAQHAADDVAIDITTAGTGAHSVSIPTLYWAVRVDADHFKLALAKDANTLQIVAPRTLGLVGETMAITDNGTGTHAIVPAPGAELRTVAYGARTAHVMIQAYGDQAFRMLSDVIAGLELAVDDLDAAGIGIGPIEPVQQVPSPRPGNVLERRAITGLTIHLLSQLESRQTYVERVQLTLRERTIGVVATFWTPTDPT